MPGSPEIQLVTRELIAEVRAKAEASPRRRMNYNFHSSAEDNPHRFLNVMLRGTYVQPHRHLSPAKPESWIVLEGAVRLVIFDDEGKETASHRLEAGGPVMGIDIAPGVWHTVIPETDCAVVFEVKPGPWDPATDKEFAAWAPPESYNR